MAQRLNQQWVLVELFPFLDLVYCTDAAHKPKKSEEWETAITRAEAHVNTIRNYDDSIISIDRIRLALTSSPYLDVEDHMQTSQVIGDRDLVITMLVRHAITHGPYPLISLGVSKNPDALRERELLRQKGQQLPNMVKSGPGGNGHGHGPARGRGGGTSNQASFGGNQGLQNGYGMQSFMQPSMFNNRDAGYNQNMSISPTQTYDAIYGGGGQAFGNATQGAYGLAMDQALQVGIAPPASTMPSPTGVLAGPDQWYANPAMNYVQSDGVPANPGSRLLSDAIMSRSMLSPPAFVPGAPSFIPGVQQHLGLHALEFVPGARKHETLNMTGGQRW